MCLSESVPSSIGGYRCNGIANVSVEIVSINNGRDLISHLTIGTPFTKVSTRMKIHNHPFWSHLKSDSGGRED